MTKPLLLDGAMGQEIVNRGGKSGYGEWAVAALYEHPDIVKDIHSDYLQSGADVITTNTYSTTRTRLRHNDMENRFEDLVKLAGSLALEAVERTTNKRSDVQIAAGIGPLEASYISDFTLDFDQMVEQFDELMSLLASYVDIYLGETFSTIVEARAFLTAAQNHDKQAWVAWTLEDHGSDRLRSDETLHEAINTIKPFEPDAILLNCCTPNSIDKGIKHLQQSGLVFGGYANGFVEIPTSWHPTGGVGKQLTTREDLTPEKYGTFVSRWIAHGATIVGGCCDIGPAHIARLRQAIDKHE